MDEVEAFLRKKKKPGMLADAIMEGDPSQGMYQRRGWKPIPSRPYVLTYNVPEHLDPEQLLEERYRYYIEREHASLEPDDEH